MLNVLPYDCLGEIIRFIGDQKTIISLISSTKFLKDYIEDRNPKCVSKVVFTLRSIPEYYYLKILPTLFRPDPKFKPKRYVHILNFRPHFDINSPTKIRGRIFKELFPNLEKLDLVRIQYQTFDKDVFQNTPNLRKLSLEGSFVKQKSFQYLKNLESLTIDYSRVRWNHRSNGLKETVLQYVPNLLSLKLYCVNGFLNDGFKHVNKLRKLRIAFIISLDQNLFRHANQLETLEIQNCGRFTTYSPECLENWMKLKGSIKEIYLRECFGIDRLLLQQKLGVKVHEVPYSNYIKDCHGRKLGGCLAL